MKKNRKSLSHILAAAIALALPTITLAQGQIDTSRGNEASNRIGSGGRNGGYTDVSRYSNYMVNNGNRIVNGNVTMGREFRDNVGYSDPYSFRGSTAGSTSDAFIRNSSGVPQGYGAAPVPNQSVPFYGASGTVQAPPGYTMTPGRGGYVAPAPTGVRGAEDQRMGITDLNQPLAPTPIAGELVGRGSLGGQPGAQNNSIITGSSLYGVREWNPADPADRLFLDNMAMRQNSTQNMSRMDPREIIKIRNQVEDILKGEGVKPPGMISNDPIDKTLETPVDPKISGKPNDALLNGGNTNDALGMRQRLIGAHQKSNVQYTELNKRLEQYYGERRKTDADFAREFNSAMKAKKDAEEKAKLDKSKLNPVTPEKTNPATTPEGDKPKVKKPTPLKVNSIASGVKAAGLADVLKKAEGLMKEGKFASAIEQYDSAELATPSNPLLWLGRANAELGAGFFMRAEGHIRQAFMTDKSLMMGQYDLQAMLGEERVAAVVKDLKEIANKDTKPSSVFLLAYIAYNTGHEKQAVGYLDLAEKRSAAPDPFFKVLRDHWALPDDAGAPNKTPAVTPEKTPAEKAPEKVLVKPVEAKPALEAKPLEVTKPVEKAPELNK